MKQYQNKELLKEKYEELGSTRKVGKHFGVANGTIIYWMKKYHLPRYPKLELQVNKSGDGRRGELYIIGHPHFRDDVVDLGKRDDKSKRDLIWKHDTVNVKTSHYQGRPIFRIKKKRHDASLYICLRYNDLVDPAIPVEIWIIPSSKAPHSGISPSVEGKSKYDRYKFSPKRGNEFSAEEEKLYNKEFRKRFSWLLAKK